jgi:hypothetical protein
VAITLPKPSAVDSFTASPGSITSSEDPAHLNPMLVATSSQLELQVAFDDGLIRDFSRDQRVVYGLAAGSSLCEVVKGALQTVAWCAALAQSASAEAYLKRKQQNWQPQPSGAQYQI